MAHGQKMSVCLIFLHIKWGKIWQLLKESVLGFRTWVKMDIIVLVDPIAYYHMPYAKKTNVARLIGAVNWKNKGQNKHMLLMVPGRIGTSSPELGYRLHLRISVNLKRSVRSKRKMQDITRSFPMGAISFRIW